MTRTFELKKKHGLHRETITRESSALFMIALEISRGLACTVF
jgi:hypothetical protein